MLGWKLAICWSIGLSQQTIVFRQNLSKPEPNETRTRPTYYIRVVAPKKETDPFAEESEPDKKPMDPVEAKDPSSRKITDESKGRSEPSETPRASDPSDKPTESRDSSDSSAESGTTGGSTSGSGDSGGKRGENAGKSQSEGSKSGGSAAEGSSGAAGNSPSGNSSSSDGGSRADESGGERTSGDKSDEPLHPGEVFERVLDHLEEQKKRNGERSEDGFTREETESNGGSQV